VSGLSVVGRDRYGVFPLRGKLLNVRDASHDQIMNNAEITYIKQILGRGLHSFPFPLNLSLLDPFRST
jgi:DNA gyrase/topoisomerase IV subunit B